MTLKELFIVLPQYLMPQHKLSALMSILMHCENRFLKNLFIKLVIRLYCVNMSEAKNPEPDYYPSFNTFFTRELKAGIRPIAASADAIASPADGIVSQAGPISAGRIFQAKDYKFTTAELLGDKARAEAFENGSFATIYLSPKDYHRLHMPLAGTLREMLHIPGRLFSVNSITVDSVPNLFARNERVVCMFDTEAGPMALILVGAIFVSSIETVWSGIVTPPTVKEIRIWRYEDNAPQLKKGAEMGRFNMGSTVIVLFGKNKTVWKDDLLAGKTLKLGEAIGRYL